ncbi:hypothetical protein ACHAPX_010608 [Trichoderma viride]
MERWLEKKPEYAVLKGMPPPATVDSYQGQEANIMCVVLGTTKQTGPGFTRNANRLNVMLSRQKSGLIVVGDIKLASFDLNNTNENKGTGKGKGKTKGKGKGKGNEGPNFSKRLTYVEDGKKQVTQADALRKVYWRFQSKGRVVEIAAPKNEENEMEKEKSTE